MLNIAMLTMVIRMAIATAVNVAAITSGSQEEQVVMVVVVVVVVIELVRDVN